MLGIDMRCSLCQTENQPEAKSCAQCGSPLGLPVETERIRAQLKRWQERLLDMTKANPLLGINRSRVSKLGVVEPAGHILFRDFAVQEKTLKMPLVVKIARAGSGTGSDEAEAEPVYRVDPGDVGFAAKPVDLQRKLRRIYDN